MSESAQAADLAAKQALELSEAAIRLAALGMVNLARLVYQASQDKNMQVIGETNLKKIVLSGVPLAVFQIKAEDLKTFKSEAKQFAITYSAIQEKGQETGLCDIVALKSDVGLINRIFERMGYPAPIISGDEKNADALAPRERGSGQKKAGSREQGQETHNEDVKPSVRNRLDQAKASLQREPMAPDLPVQEHAVKEATSDAKTMLRR